MKSSLDRTLAGSSIAGTLEYAAPEQMGKLKGVAVGTYSDVYGFGRTCCFALFGTPQPTFQHWQKLPRGLADLLGRCLSEQPRERPQNFTEVLRELRPHVIALSEVDRAWFLNGGHDDLRLIAESLGLRMIWAPAADEVWGDALLTNLPVTSVRNHVLVQGGPTGAQALGVGLRWNGRDITVIATHLQPPSGWEPLDQVEQLADIVRAAPKPTVVAGDLNLDLVFLVHVPSSRALRSRWRGGGPAPARDPSLSPRSA